LCFLVSWLFDVIPEQLSGIAGLAPAFHLAPIVARTKEAVPV